MGWSKKDLERMQAAGKIRSFKELHKKQVKICTGKQVKICKASQKEPKALQFIKKTLQDANIAYETEYVFAPGRRFRFDIAIHALQVAIEYEGLMSKKSRHTTPTGFTRDTTKYNLAQSLGWKVYRYTTINYKEFENDLKAVLT